MEIREFTRKNVNNLYRVEFVNQNKKRMAIVQANCSEEAVYFATAAINDFSFMDDEVTVKLLSNRQKIVYVD